jgi:hypothetical protein
MTTDDFTLSPDEARALHRALDNYLPELRYELARIKLERERRGMVRFDEVLEQLQRRLIAWEEERRIGALTP